jgi:serine/threonine-protein kinase
MDLDLIAQQRVGTTLRGKWRLERLLGVGGMAAVYVGVHSIGQRQAIKILHPDIARSPEQRARFEREAHAVNRLKHPGAVEIRDIDVTEDGAPFLVMELLEGESLAERAARLGAIEEGELLRLMDELLDVLAAAHAQGIIHRDVKLDNLFVQRDGRLKVLDFGIARMRSGKEGDVHTRTGAALGTVPYMAPEQIKGVDVDARVDLFAVGATMFRLIARRRVHEAETEPMLLIKMATEPAPKLATVAPGAPEGLCLVVDRALQFQREQRYPDALTMQRDVQALRAGAAPPYASALAQGGGVPSGYERTQAAAPLAMALAAAPPPASVDALTNALPPASAAWSAAALEPTMHASAVAQPPPAAVAKPVADAAATRAAEERKVLVIAIAAIAAMLLLLIVVVLVRRGSDAESAPAAAATSDPPAADDSEDPAWRYPAAKRHGPKPPKKKHGHGKGRGKDDEE